MYLPYLRGKQFELLAARELSQSLSPATFRPIIEPVRANLSPLLRTIKYLNDNKFKPLVVLNPSVGDFKGSHSHLFELLGEAGIDYLPCAVVRGGNVAEARAVIRSLSDGFALQITGGIDNDSIQLATDAELTVVDSDLPPAAISRLANTVLFGDFFKKQKRNADYSKESSFSHLHTSFQNINNSIGFSDYTIVGSDYSESGGPAYVVTIHLSYINKDMFDEMFVRHYSSTDDGTPTDPAGKFAEALENLIFDVDNENIYFASTSLDEFRALHSKGHFPGLGQVKKLSMKHHIETVCNFLEEGQ
ncbi:sce7725 family protein [Aliagarivorans marinus]|uniref:sce7725 family protein n=1 Tax=Aliagarivorans marinus TaxID=561965 RepID=UPI000409B2F2|nr:sce7725 family protein [Aliagarivorans marinus]